MTTLKFFILPHVFFSLIVFSSMAQLSHHYFIKFSKIDNQAKVYVDDSLVITTKLYDENPDLDVRYDLNKFLKKGKNNVRVELLNGSGDWFFEFDSDWEIFYEIFKNNDPIDFMSEDSSEGGLGLVFSFTHEIYVE